MQWVKIFAEMFRCVFMIHTTWNLFTQSNNPSAELKWNKRRYVEAAENTMNSVHLQLLITILILLFPKKRLSLLCYIWIECGNTKTFFSSFTNLK